MPSPGKRSFSLLLCLMMAFSLIGLASSPTAPEEAPGFKVVDRSRLELVSADVTVYEHEKTGALVMVLENQDTNRTFNISFRTPTENDMGIPHIFEHATLGGSQKYPSKTLFFNLVNQTYNTYLNAMTTDIMTTYPSASLSEDQLLKYADFYADSVFNPMIMEDESIFKEEAWRYSLTDKDAPLTLAGTVYTEMQGAYSIQTAAMFNFKKALFPGSRAGNSYGGHPEHIKDMSWEDLKNYHDAYYHPSNSLTTLYGKFEQIPAFLSMLDGYFSQFEKKEFDLADSRYAPISSPVTLTVDFPVEAGSSTNNGAVVYYGFACPQATPEDEQAMDLLTTLLAEQSSYLQQEMKKQLPQASMSCYYDNATPDTSVVFEATGLNPDQAETFKAVVDQSLMHIKENGFDTEAVEAVAAATRLALLLSTENANVGPAVLPSIAYFWAATGDTGAYSDYVDNSANYVAFAQEGKYQALISKYLENNPQTALVVTAPKPGLKEEKDAQLKEELAQIKAGMSPEAIEALVAETAKMGEQEADDSAQYVAQLQAVTVDSLPLEKRKYTLDDRTGEDEVRYITVDAEVSGVGQALLYLDASALPQESIHWFKLYTDLLGKLDTHQHDNATLSALMTRYLYGREMRMSALTDPKTLAVNPKLRVNFIAIDEDLAPAYDLVYEVLFETDFSDAGKVLSVVNQIKTSLKSTITNNSYNIQAYRAFASADQGFAYFNYASFLDYYAFLEQVEAQLADNPQEALDQLAGVQEALRNRRGTITGFAGNKESQEVNRVALAAFLGSLNNTPREAAKYSFEEIPATEALVVDSAVQYNLIFATFEQLGIPEFIGSLDAMTALVSDLYLYPLLRDQYGVYGVDHAASETGLYILSFRDPNIAETYEVYESLYDKIATAEVSEEALQGYILSAYSYYAVSKGELAGALSAMIAEINDTYPDQDLTYMRQLKEITPPRIKDFAILYKNLIEKGLRSTSGGAAKIAENEGLFLKVHNPFQVVDTSNATYDDLEKSSPYYQAVRYALDNKLLEPMNQTTFGMDEPANFGEMARSLYILVGGSGTPEKAIVDLEGYKLIVPGFQADRLLTRNDVALQMATFLPGVSIDLAPAGLPPMPEVADADQIVDGALPGFRFLLGAEMLGLKEDGSLAPEAAFTRAELAQILFALGGE